MSNLGMSMFSSQALYWKARAESAEADRDRYRDALIACRPAVVTALSYLTEYGPRKGARDVSAILDTIDAAAKGQG